MNNNLNYSTLNGITEELLLSDKPCRLFVGGNSMYPHIQKGMYVTIHKVPYHKLERGDVVVFRTDAKYIAHRLIRLKQTDKGTVLITKGDSLKRADAPVTPDRYFGKITAIESKGRIINCESKSYKCYSRFLAAVTFYTPPVYSVFRFFRHL